MVTFTDSGFCYLSIAEDSDDIMSKNWSEARGDEKCGDTFEERLEWGFQNHYYAGNNNEEQSVLFSVSSKENHFNEYNQAFAGVPGARCYVTKRDGGREEYIVHTWLVPTEPRMEEI